MSDLQTVWCTVYGPEKIFLSFCCGGSQWSEALSSIFTYWGARWAIWTLLHKFVFFWLQSRIQNWTESSKPFQRNTHSKECFEVCYESKFDFGESSLLRTGACFFHVARQKMKVCWNLVSHRKSSTQCLEWCPEGSSVSQAAICFTLSSILATWLGFFLSCSVSSSWCCTDQEVNNNKWCIAIRSSIEIAFHCVESAQGSQEAINFGLVLIHVSFALFSFPLWRRVLRTPPLPPLRQSAPITAGETGDTER